MIWTAGRDRQRRRRLLLFCAALSLFAICSAGAVVRAGFAETPVAPSIIAPADNILSRDSVLRDPDVPSLGNPNGDLTIVEYFDYQCPFCKKAAPLLERVVRDDRGVKVMLKDWPIFGAVSAYAARMALAANFQNKYPQAHAALIGAKAKLTQANIRGLLAGVGVDVAKATLDLQRHRQAIDAVLKRNAAQAEAFGFQGTPSFIIGTFRVPLMLTADQFRQAIADARAAAAKP
jgi:protein-disulfide isomerase